MRTVCSIRHRPNECAKAAPSHIVAAQQLFRTKRTNSSLLLDLIIDGRPLSGSYHSPKYWAALFHFAVAEGHEVIIRDMDLPGRFARLFPQSLMAQLRWFANYHGDCPPVACLFDPDGKAEIFLLHTVASGLAVEVVHNLTSIGYSRETLWLADIMALRPMLGVDLILARSLGASRLGFASNMRPKAIETEPSIGKQPTAYL